jgi:hypothetical protein
LPLLPLTNGGATREIVQKMLTDLQRPEHKDLALVGYTLAYLIFQRKYPGNLDWLERNFKGMQDILHESQLYQMIMQEGEVKGHEKGLAEGIAKGREEELRQTIVSLVQDRFPELESLAARQVAIVANIARLRRFIIKISRASEAKEVAGMLLDLPQEASQGQ